MTSSEYYFVEVIRTSRTMFYVHFDGPCRPRFVPDLGRNKEGNAFCCLILSTV